MATSTAPAWKGAVIRALRVFVVVSLIPAIKAAISTGILGGLKALGSSPKDAIYAALLMALGKAIRDNVKGFEWLPF